LVARILLYCLGTDVGLQVTGKKIVLVSAIPVMTQDPPSFIGRAQALHEDLETLGRPRRAYDQETRRWRAFVLSLHAQYHTQYFDPSASLCDDRLCHMYRSDTGVLYFNSDHLSLKGAAFVSRDLAKEIYTDVSPAKAQSQMASLKVNASR
jgi:hypothetical protein